MTMLPKPAKRQPKPRKRIRRRQAPRPQRKGKAADARRAAHDKWRAIVMAKNGGWCVVSGWPADDPAHIFPRGRYRHIATDPANGLPLSRYWHDYYTPRQAAWLKFAEAFIGTRAFARLREKAMSSEKGAV